MFHTGGQKWCGKSKDKGTNLEAIAVVLMKDKDDWNWFFHSND